MRKKIVIIASLVALLALLMATTAYAKKTNYTYTDVELNGQIGEIEAGVKTTNKNDYSECTYFSDDYQDALGYYADAEIAGNTAEEVLEFCVEHFDERTQ